jgi:hypothetical protein
LLAPVLAVGLTAWLIASSAGFNGPSVSVQKTGVFELEGDATTEATPPPPFDWDKVYAQCITENKCGENPGATDGANVRSFVTDRFNVNNDTIFTGGSTKDGLPLAGWQWTEASVQAKNDLEHAYAAEYQTVKECEEANPSNCANHTVLFFGTDRFSNNGDSNVGFWFLKSNVGPAAIPAGQKNGKFTGVHHEGDILVVSELLKGGEVPQLSVYKWVGNDATGSPKLITTIGAADCTPGVDTHGEPVPEVSGPACATVNTAQTSSPWPYTEKASDGGVVPNKFSKGTFFEGGIDLTSLDLANQCFSSFLAETRSSQSITATLSDFAGGTFAPCSASMTTTPEGPAGSNLESLLPGTSVTDTATVTGSGLTEPPFPTSSTNPADPGAPGTPVSFTLCGPNSTVNCSSVGTANLTNTATQGVSRATSPPVARTTPGTYCFTATWGGDANYPATIVDTNPGEECFTIAPLPTATITTPVDGGGVTLSEPALGSEAFDRAVVTAFTDSSLSTPTGAGGFPSGTVTFFVCEPGKTSGSPGAETCEAGTQVGSPVATTEVAAAVPAHSQSKATSSPGVTLTKAGVWCFRATYAPGPPNGANFVSTGSGDSSHTECFTVPPAASSTVTTPRDGSGVNLHEHPPVLTSPSGFAASDEVMVTGVVGAGDVTGSVAFSICGPVASGTCSASGNPPFDTQTLKVNAGASPPSSSATSTGVTITQVGTYCFFAKYTPDTVNYTGSSDSSTTECFTVTDTSSTESAQRWRPNDSATFGTAGGTPLNGTVKFTLYPNATCDTSAAPLYTEPTMLLLGAPSPVKESTNNSSVEVSTSQSVSWLVQFESSDPLVASSSHCEHTGLTIVN